MKNINKGSVVVVAVIVVIVLAIIGGGVWYYVSNKPEPKACTLEAKLCPGGTYVSRTGPNCEFAECPVAEDQFKDWKTYRNEKYGFELKYPVGWKISCISGRQITNECRESFETEISGPAENDHPGKRFMNIAVVIRESVVQKMKEIENCEAECCWPTLSTAGWDNEEKLLESNLVDGDVNCVEGIYGRSLCEIKTYGQNRFLVRYTGRGDCGSADVIKTYIIYKNSTRYEITPPSLNNQVDPILFKNIENQSIQKVCEDIVKSFILF